MPSEPYSFAALRNRLNVVGTLVATTALRIGAGRESGVLGSDLPVLRDATGAPFIPGASLKGTFRARVEALVRSVNEHQALDLGALEARTRNAVADLRRQGMEDDEFSQKIWQMSTVIDKTFGSPELAGRLLFRDAPVDRAFWFDRFEIRNGVGIDRDTETVSQSLLYNYEVVPAGTPFSFALTLESAEPWQLGLVLAALQPWQRGEVQLGGFRSRGLGYVRLDYVQLDYVELHSADDVLRLLDGTASPVDDEQRQAWRKAFVSELRGLAERQGAANNA